MTQELPDGEKWFVKYWRPTIAWVYVLIILFDFIVFPVLYTVGAEFYHQQYHEWKPMTLENGGLFHLAMGSIIGIYTWQRTQEKIRFSQFGVGFPFGGGGGSEGDAERTEDKVTKNNGNGGSPRAD